MLADYYTPLTLERAAYVGDNVPKSYAAVSGSHTGFIQPVSGNEQFKIGKAGEKVTHRLYTDVSSPAIYKDRVTQNGQVYYVVFAGQPTGISGVNDHKEILLMADF